MHDLDSDDKKDLEEFLRIYRTAKNMGKFFVWGLGIALVIATLMLTIKEYKK